MRLAVIGVNQAAAVKLGLDIVDLSILDWFYTFSASGNMEIQLKNNLPYYWVSYSKVMDDLPVLGLTSPRSVANRFRKLVEAGILEVESLTTVRGKRSYFRLRTEAYTVLYEDNAMSLQNDMEGKSHVTENSQHVTDDVHAMSLQNDMDGISLSKERSIPDNLLGIEGSDLSAEARAEAPAEDPVFISIPLNVGVYEVTKAEVQQMQEIYPAVDVEQAYRNMRGWAIGNPRRRKTARGVRAFINSWLCKEQDKASRTGKASAKTSNANFDGQQSGSVRI